MKRLTIKTFVLLLVLSMAVIFFAYGCIWIFLPYANKKQAQRRLDERTQMLVSELRVTGKGSSERLFTEFISEGDADLLLLDSEGKSVSEFTFKEIDTEIFEGDRYPFRFADSEEEYVILTRCNWSRQDEITDAMIKSIPFVAAVAVVLSFISAFIFSRYTTSPIIRISEIAGRMAELDFSWYCPDVRDDEIGTLSKNINELSDKLNEALEEIHRRNLTLEDEISFEKERERRRMLFFSGVSHELKTPIAVVIGQLEGMQAEIGVYKDREKYLARSAEILQSLNSFIKEILFVAHIDTETQAVVKPVSLSEILNCLIDDYSEYAELSSVKIVSDVERDMLIYGDEALLKKALGNIIGNAVTHSGENGQVSIRLYHNSGKAELAVINSPAHIDEEHLPHLFEAFYRAGRSSRQGSGLGLYITRMILETYLIPHSITNTSDGVKFTATFQKASN